MALSQESLDSIEETVQQAVTDAITVFFQQEVRPLFEAQQNQIALLQSELRGARGDVQQVKDIARHVDGKAQQIDGGIQNIQRSI